MLLATARFVITTIQRKFLYFFVFFFPKVPRSLGKKEEEQNEERASPHLPLTQESKRAYNYRLSTCSLLLP